MHQLHVENQRLVKELNDLRHRLGDFLENLCRSPS